METVTFSAFNLCFYFDPETQYSSGVLSSLFLSFFLHWMDFQVVEAEAWKDGVEHVWLRASVIHFSSASVLFYKVKALWTHSISKNHTCKNTYFCFFSSVKYKWNWCDIIIWILVWAISNFSNVYNGWKLNYHLPYKGMKECIFL